MKNMRLLLTGLLCFIAVGFVSAQNINVTGTVKDATNGEPIGFAYVQIKGTTTGTSTNDDGTFSIKVPEDGVLIFSFVGYKTTEVEVNGRTRIDVLMESDALELDETLVVAYGTQKKSSFVGSATQLKGESLKKMQTTNVSKALEGAVAGLQTSSSSGTPGSGASIQIRGFGSVSASRDPLIVVDGTPYEGGLNSIPPQDIESITVLKDAAANSMYGARGSNGVIMITTKRGVEGKVTINFDAKVGVNSRAVPAYDVISNPGQYYEMAWEAMRNSVYYAGTIADLAEAGRYASANLINGDGGLGPYNIYKNVADDAIIDPTTGRLNPNATTRKWNDDWNKDVFRNGLRQEYSLSVSGGSDKTQGYMSVSYLDDEGYVPKSGFKRVAVRTKLDQAVTSFIKAGINLAYSNTDQNRYNENESNNYSNMFMFTQNIAPIYPIYLYDENGVRQYNAKGETLYDWGETGRAYAPTSNPYGQALTSKAKDISDNVSTRGYLNINILKDLVFTANVAYDVFNTKRDYYTTPNGGDAKNVGGRGYQYGERYTALNANQLLTWSPSFGEHNLNVLVGHETKSDDSYTLYGHMTNFVNPTVSDFANATVYQDLSSYRSDYFLEGVFGRVEYNYANKYYFTASYRTDGSSRFAKDKRWGSFWAVGASWNAKAENFLKDVDWVELLKVKASYGTQGNDNIGYTKVYENLYRVDRVDGSASLTQTFRAAPDVTWEKSNNFNVGIETRLFNKLSVNVEYFVKETKDMIYAQPLAPSQGTPASQLVNDMDMKNSGIEFEISADLFRTKDFSWNISLNGTHYKNKITKLPSDYPAEGKQYGSFWREKGGSLFNYYMYEWAGVDQTNGLPQYYKYDDNGERSIVNTTSEATYRKTGKSPIPDLYGGVATTFTFKGFDLSANFAYQIGGYTIDYAYQGLMSAGSSGTNWHKDILNRWTSDNTNTGTPRVQMNYQEANSTSTRWLTKSSYFSIRNLTLGYTIPRSITSKIGLSNIRVYVTADNLFYTSARKGLDVRRSFEGGTGLDDVNFSYSALRTISGGLSITL